MANLENIIKKYEDRIVNIQSIFDSSESDEIPKSMIKTLEVRKESYEDIISELKPLLLEMRSFFNKLNNGQIPIY